MADSTKTSSTSDTSSTSGSSGSDKYYSWSNMVLPDPATLPPPPTVIKPGDEVNAGMFSSQEEFDQLVEAGAIRTDEYPATSGQ